MDWLKERKIDYEYRDIKKDNPTYDELKVWTARSELPLTRFWNTSGMAYRALDMKTRRPNMTDDEQLQLLSTDGMLVKRPLIVTDEWVLSGFKEAEWAEKLGV